MKMSIGAVMQKGEQMNDLISRQDAIDAVSDCGICIQKIVDLPSAQKNDEIDPNDLISRKALYEKTARWESQAMALLVNAQEQGKTDEMLRLSTVLQERTAFKHDVADAPSAQKTGKWKLLHKGNDTSDYECTNCRGILMDVANDDHHELQRYCGMCGAMMVGEEE